MKYQGKDTYTRETVTEYHHMTDETQRLVKDSKQLLDALRLGEVGAWRWRIGSDELWWSENLTAMHALPPPGFDGTLSSFQKDLHPDDAETVWEDIRQSVQTGLPYRTTYRTMPCAGHETQWFEATGGVVVDDSGAKYLTGTCIDVTRRVQMERELERRLRQQQLMRALSSFALGESDFGKILRYAVHAAAEIFEVPLVKIMRFAEPADHLVLIEGVGWKEGIVGQTMVDADEGSQAGYTLRSGIPIVISDLATETGFRGSELLTDHEVVSGMSTIIAGEDDSRPFGVFCVYAREPGNFKSHDVDILTSLANIVARAARQQASAKRQELLMREMAHRAGNLLQVVCSIANRTLLDTVDQAARRGAFVARLQALSRINQMIAASGWQSIRFSELICEILDDWREKVRLTGHNILLPADLCFDLGLVMHEISTNSVKYGSLGRDNGLISIRWDILKRPTGRYLQFEWTDPISLAAPESGFGQEIVRGLILEKWNGSLEEGGGESYRLRLEIPLHDDLQQ
jgi:two-component sensor histidine kinase